MRVNLLTKNSFGKNIQYMRRTIVKSEVFARNLRPLVRISGITQSYREDIFINASDFLLLKKVPRKIINGSETLITKKSFPREIRRKCFRVLFIKKSPTKKTYKMSREYCQIPIVRVESTGNPQITL
jgi:hypothetical protein